MSNQNTDVLVMRYLIQSTSILTHMTRRKKSKKPYNSALALPWQEAILSLEATLYKGAVVAQLEL